MLTVLSLFILSQKQDFELILVSFDSARGALSNELHFQNRIFHPKIELTPPFSF